MLAVPALIGVAAAPNLVWYFAAWIIAGFAVSGVLYQPAFAALTRWWGPRRRPSAIVGARRSGSPGCSPRRSRWPSPCRRGAARRWRRYSAVFAVLATLAGFAALISLASMPARAP
ncbi:hypothetical protein [Saccharopolyspora pogona]|uniref:hypothetical protein n=1 Tax=Saccharopolyspora pogona TaxID=333966 RepID=UPI0016888A95|nr:hypothetical protein [Saccharopolyspora pogona]